MLIRKSCIRSTARKLFLTFDYIAWLLLDPSKFRIIHKNKIKTVLFFHNGALGEILVTTPLLKAIKENLNCKIIYLIGKGSEKILEGNPNVDKIIAYDENHFDVNVRNLKKERIDLAFIFRASLKFALLCKMAGIKYRVGGFGGLKRSPSFLFTRRRFPVSNKSSVETNLEIIRQIGIGNLSPKTELFLHPTEITAVKDKLRKLKVKEYFIIHPGYGQASKGDNSKKWDSKEYAKLIDLLTEKYGCHTLLTGVKSEESISQEIIDNVKQKKLVVNSTGMFTLRELFALISGAKLIVAPDTGPGHVAAAFETPLVNLMSVFTPREWGPAGNEKKIVNLYHPKGYEITFPFVFKKRNGLSDLKAEEVFLAAKSII